MILIEFPSSDDVIWQGRLDRMYCYCDSNTRTSFEKVGDYLRLNIWLYELNNLRGITKVPFKIPPKYFIHIEGCTVCWAVSI